MNRHDFGARAEDNLRFIRDTMERSTRFTAVSGWGGVGMGVVGLVAALVGLSMTTGGLPWLLTWLSAAAIAAPVGSFMTWRKARRIGLTFGGGSARKFALCFFPVVLAGAIVTWTLARSTPEALPAAWLSMYGAAIVAGGAFSVSALPAMGAGFLALGALVALLPMLGDLALLVGFGVLQIGFGTYIAARHDG